MLFATWVNTRIGKGTDYDGAFGVQCVDLIKDFEKQVLEIIPQACGDAWEYFAKYDNNAFLKANFIKIPNTREFVPKKGDVVVWSRGLGTYGHVAVATGEGHTGHFYSYDQNWHGRHDVMTRVYHSYDYVYGVLRPRNQKNITGSSNTTSNTSSNTYQVKITTNNLNVRKGAGVNYGLVYNNGKVLQVHKCEVYTIVQTVKNGAYTWGKLKSGAGWIALDYTSKV